jgi:hypothetical protein
MASQEFEAAMAKGEAMKERQGSVEISAMEGWSGRYVEMEVSGLAVDMGMGEQFVSGSVVLSRESALAAMWSLGKSLGEPDQTEKFLASVFGWSD